MRQTTGTGPPRPCAAILKRRHRRHETAPASTPARGLAKENGGAATPPLPSSFRRDGIRIGLLDLERLRHIPERPLDRFPPGERDKGPRRIAGGRETQPFRHPS